MKIGENPRFQQNLPELIRVLSHVFGDLARQLNALSSGRVSAVTNASTSAPTAGEYAVGDFVRNSTPVEAGAPTAKYVITGWVCTSASPLVFKECRTLTGA
jgi:hypothetical protein